MTDLFAVMAITLLAVISPGPDFAMVTRNSLMASRRAGLLTALGIAAAVWVHIAYTMAGIGLIIQQSIVLFTIVKLVGAAYLVFLGLSMLRGRPADAEAASPIPSALDGSAAFRVGFLTNALNPKTTVFIVSLFVQVVSPETSLATQIAYGGFISASHFVWFVLVALFFSQEGLRNRLMRVRHSIDRVFGALLVGLGVSLALSTTKR